MIATNSDIKEFLKITSSDDDDLLTRLAAAAQAFIEKECNRTFEDGETTNKIDGEGDDTIFLSNLPVVSLTSVHINDVEMTLSDYKFDEDTGEVWHKDENNFAKGRNNVVVVYQSGFSTVPADVKQAVIELASTMYKKNREAGVSSQSIGDFSVTFDSESMPPTAQVVIENYTIHNL